VPILRSVHTGSILLVSAAIFLLIVVTALFSLTVGSTGISVHDVVSILLSALGIGSSSSSDTIRTIVLTFDCPDISFASRRRIAGGIGRRISGSPAQPARRTLHPRGFERRLVGALVAIASGISTAILGGTTILAFIGAAAVIGIVYLFGSRRGIIESGSLLYPGS